MNTIGKAYSELQLVDELADALADIKLPKSE